MKSNYLLKYNKIVNLIFLFYAYMIYLNSFSYYLLEK